VHGPGVVGGEVVAEHGRGRHEGALRAAAGRVRARVPVRVHLVVGDGAAAAKDHEGARHHGAADVDVQVRAAVHEGGVAAALAAVARTALAAAVVAEAVPGGALRDHNEHQITTQFYKK